MVEFVQAGLAALQAPQGKLCSDSLETSPWDSPLDSAAADLASRQRRVSVSLLQIDNPGFRA